MPPLPLAGEGWGEGSAMKHAVKQIHFVEGPRVPTKALRHAERLA